MKQEPPDKVKDERERASSPASVKRSPVAFADSGGCGGGEGDGGGGESGSEDDGMETDDYASETESAHKPTADTESARNSSAISFPGPAPVHAPTDARLPISGPHVSYASIPVALDASRSSSSPSSSPPMDVATLRAEIKSWERDFRANHGRDPSIQEIKDQPAIGVWSLARRPPPRSSGL